MVARHPADIVKTAFIEATVSDDTLYPRPAFVATREAPGWHHSIFAADDQLAGRRASHATDRGRGHLPTGDRLTPSGHMHLLVFAREQVEERLPRDLPALEMINDERCPILTTAATRSGGGVAPPTTA